jgi:hypothetical protein
LKTARVFAVLATFAVLFGAGCSGNPASPKPAAPTLAANDTPTNAAARLVGSYEQKNQSAFAGMLTGDFNFEFSNSTDPTLVQQYPTGWARVDESESSSHLFSGYTPQGGSTLPAATSIVITLADSTPVDDNTSGIDPATHKVLATRVDGSVTVPQSGSEPLTYVIANNYDVFYFVRGDVAAGLDETQPADAQHWYLNKWVDLSQNYIPRPDSRRGLVTTNTWGKLKALYRN